VTGQRPAVVTIGETMAALRTDGPLRLGGTTRWSIAGAESTVAIGLARLGHAARWVGRVGADEPGALVLRTLRAEAVDTALAHVDPFAPTGLILFEARVADLTRVSYYRAGSAGSRLTPADLDGGLPEGIRIVHVTGITPALGAGPAEAVLAAMEAGHRLGAEVCLDVNYRSRLWSRADAARALRPLLGMVDILIASDDELPIVAPGADAAGTTGGAAGPGQPPGADDPAGALVRAGVREVVVTSGADGARAVTAEGTAAVPARAVPVVDPVGAGDAFVAGYLSGVLEGLPVTERLQRAVTTAGFAVATRGDWEGLPTRAELALLDASPGTTIR
jgi:2-dehydro-3-deoxygluconokinase